MCVELLCFIMAMYVVIDFISSFAIILNRMRGRLVVLFSLYSCFKVCGVVVFDPG